MIWKNLSANRISPLPLAVLFAAVGLVQACSTDTPTAPTTPTLRLARAQVLVGGSAVNGMTMSVDHGAGEATRFEATLVAPLGPAHGYQVSVRYSRPGGMMHNSGEFMMYDDGTHGDLVAGDGVYCYEDWDDEYGCAGEGMLPGEYHYDFFGMDHDGAHTNHMGVTVTLE